MALLGSLLWDSLASILLLTLVAYYYLVSNFDFFKKRGVEYVRPVPFFGNFASVMTGKTSFSSAIVPIYEKLKKHGFGGVFIFRTPIYVVCDPEMIKLILTKDFSHLHDRGISYNEDNDPMSVNLVNVNGARWKNLRSKLSPTFSSGKLKAMFPLMKEVSDDMAEVLKKSASQGKNIEMREMLMRYSTDVVASCAFGISSNSVKNNNSEFYGMSRKIFETAKSSNFRTLVLTRVRMLLKRSSFDSLFPGVHKFFIDLMRNTVSYRIENNIERPDFVNLMMELHKADREKIREHHPDEVLFTEDVMAAQAFVFFSAGQDSIANTIGFALHHMSVDPRIQEDLADEITSAINHYGELSYEVLKNMKLLDQIVSESLRMYTQGGLLIRVVNSPNYTLPGTDVSLEKGKIVFVPVNGLHYDPDIYPDPYKFDPFHFSEDSVSRRHPYAYLPFGEGPRMCIANRFAILQSKLCLASLIKDFKFSVCSETQIPLELETRITSGPTPKKGFRLKIEIRSEYPRTVFTR